METGRNLWPCSCSSTGKTDEDGNELYVDTKPMAEARIGLGLYTDSRCRYDYTGNMDISEVIKDVEGDNEYGSVSDLERSLQKWNDAFDVYKVCQPCKAYNLGYNKDLNNGNREGGDDDQPFSCYDDAGYVDVNQCMKFKTKTEMLAADFRDIMLAHEQGNIVEFEVMGKTYGYGGYRTNTGTLQTGFTMNGVTSVGWQSYAYMGAAILFAAGAFVYFMRMRSRVFLDLKTPLVDSSS